MPLQKQQRRGSPIPDLRNLRWQHPAATLDATPTNISVPTLTPSQGRPALGARDAARAIQTAADGEWV